ncbi:MAG: DUF349 domain-containing protein [Bacteroidetes bacterium]|nr:DUF349 domain-containing protein [Bacteroidota bacterium]
MKEKSSPDQNPEEVSKTNQEENLQPNEVENSILSKTNEPSKEGTPEAEVSETAGLPVAEETIIENNEVKVEEPVLEETVAVAETAEIAEPAAEIEIRPEEVSIEQPVIAEQVAEAPIPVAEAPISVPEEIPVIEETLPVVEESTPEQIEPVVAEPAVKGKRKAAVAEETKVHSAEDVEEEEEEVEEVITIGLDHKTREQLVELLEETVKNEDVNVIKNQIVQIKVAYLARTNEEREKMYQKAAAEEEAESFEVTDPLEERFKIAFNIYKQSKARFSEQIEREKIQNLEAKKHILEELKTLISSEETLKKTYDDFKVLQERWKAIGMVPKNEAPGMWQNYHFLIEKFFDKVKINKELKDLDLRKNLQHKIELCEKAEELIIEPSITKSFKRLQELHEEWKELGPVPQDKREEVWDRFKTASDKINERRHEFYGKVQEEQDANHAAKVVLCEQAEQLVNKDYSSIKQWQESTQQVNELLKVWKSVGQASPKVNNEVWVRFKGHLDAYFANKKDFFGKLKEQQLHNYNIKVDLCVQAEALRLSSEWRNSSRDLIRLQEEWKKIGPVPRKHSDKIWKRFRTACDEFFQRKSEFFKNIQSTESENLVKKEELLKKLVEFEYVEDRQANLETVKELQRQWMETGHVPIKEKDRLQTDYKAAVNKIYDKLKMDVTEQRNSNYRNRFENVREQPDAHRIINKERNSLQSRIDELKEEILLWENNIGFFANSKQANVLKSEFEAKIARAKEELAGMEAKKKFLQKAAREQEQQDQQKQ